MLLSVCLFLMRRMSRRSLAFRTKVCKIYVKQGNFFLNFNQFCRVSGSVRALITNTGRKNEVLLLCVAAITLLAKRKKKWGGEFSFSFGIGLNLFGNLYCLMVAGVLFEGRLFSVSAPVIS